jgi:hypothetical protein
MDNMPSFMIGKMEAYDGTFYNEVREFGLPVVHLRGDAKLGRQLLEGALDHHVDLSYSDELAPGDGPAGGAAAHELHCAAAAARRAGARGGPRPAPGD